MTNIDFPNTSANQIFESQYSIHWARSVVKELWGSSPRVHEVISEFLDLSFDKLVFICAKRNKLYLILRYLIRDYRKNYEKADISGYTREELRLYRETLYIWLVDLVLTHKKYATTEERFKDYLLTCKEKVIDSRREN